MGQSSTYVHNTHSINSLLQTNIHKPCACAHAHTGTPCTRSWCWWSSGSLWAETDDGWKGVDDCVGWLLTPFLFPFSPFPTLTHSLSLSLSLSLSFPPFASTSKSPSFSPVMSDGGRILSCLHSSFLLLRVSASPTSSAVWPCTIYRTTVGQMRVREETDAQTDMQWDKERKKWKTRERDGGIDREGGRRWEKRSGVTAATAEMMRPKTLQSPT